MNSKGKTMDVKRKMHCDILIVGGGNAGLVSAIEAKNRGANVLLIEKAPKKARGGNTRLSGGLFRVAFPGGTKDLAPLLEGTICLREEVDIEPYSADDYFNKVIRMSEGLSDRRFTEITVSKSLETVQWMKEQGSTMGSLPCQHGTIWQPALLACEHRGPHGPGSWRGFGRDVYGIVERRGIEVLYETAAQSLITNADGKVCGIIAKEKDGYLQIDARSVILTCGGFQANPAWRRRYLGANWDS